MSVPCCSVALVGRVSQAKNNPLLIDEILALGSAVMSVEATYTIASQLQAVKYVDVAGLSILVADYCITFEKEVNLMWKSKWSIVKVLFLFSRYAVFAEIILVFLFTFGSGMSASRCESINWVLAWLNLFIVAMSEAILVLRTAAVWSNSKRLLTGLISLYLMVAIVAIPIVILFVKSITYNPVPNVAGCNPVIIQPVGVKRYLFVIFPLIMFFETVLLGLTVYRIINYFRHSRSPLLQTMYMDGILYYFCIFIISVANIASYAVLPSTLKDLMETLYYVMHSVLPCRIILHLRAVDSQRYETSGLMSQPIEFASLRQQRSFFLRTIDTPTDLSTSNCVADARAHLT